MINLRKNNSEIKEDILIEKVQKLLDRFLFIEFCEDKGLLPKNIYHNTIEKGKQIDDIFEIFKSLCSWIDEGNKKYGINKYNGGLFKKDEILNNLIIDNDVFLELEKISEYDFDTELNENILGHIFEQSISDIEELKSKEVKEGKRKKDGIFYTPKYITEYIVKNTIEYWLMDKRKELGEDKLPKLTEKDTIFDIYKKNYSKNYRKHIEFWEKYREVVRNIKVVDPACGYYVIIMTEVKSLIKSRVLVLLQNIKTLKINNLCVV